MLRAKWIAVLGALAAASGCVVEVTFDPIGGDVAVDGSWTIDGGPATVESCATAGITDIELQIFDSVRNVSYTDGTLRGACEDGGFTTGPFLLADTYRLQWVAYDGIREVGRSGFQSVSAAPGDTILADVDFLSPEPAFDPTGGDVSLDVTWTIGGGVADAGTCAANGITDVEVLIWNQAGTMFFSDPALRVGCANGAFVTDPFLLPGTYQLQFAARGAGGTVETLDRVTVTANAGDTIVADADFTAAAVDTTIEGSWTINGMTPTIDNCLDNGVDGVRVSFYNDAAGTDLFRSYDFDCETGLFDGRVTGESLPPAMFYSQWDALDASDRSIGASALEEFDTSVVTHAVLRPINFEILAPTLDITFMFETDFGSGLYDTCEGSGVDRTFGYELIAGDGVTVVDSMFGIACANGLEYTDLASDTYSIDVNADATDGTKWGVLCDGLVLGAGGVSSYNCNVPVVP